MYFANENKSEWMAISDTSFDPIFRSPILSRREEFCCIRMALSDSHSVCFLCTINLSISASMERFRSFFSVTGHWQIPSKDSPLSLWLATKDIRPIRSCQKTWPAFRPLDGNTPSSIFSSKTPELWCGCSGLFEETRNPFGIHITAPLRGFGRKGV